MNWRGEKVFITGIDGFVGSHIARALLRQGAEVSGLLHKPLSRDRSGLLLWDIASLVKTCVGDVADKDLLESYLIDANPGWILHLAAQTIISDAQRDALQTLQTNVRGTYNIVYLASKLPKLRAVIVASSDKAYGSSPVLPYTEETPLRGGSIYDSSKASADLLACALSARFDLPLGVTRCANIYGPGDLNFTRIVPGSLAALARGDCPVIRGHGLHRRDMFYIDDAIAAYLILADYIQGHKARGLAFNFGFGKAVRVLDLVRMIMRTYGSSHTDPVILNQDTSIEILAQCVETAKARKLLGWSPSVRLSEGLKRTADWYRKHHAARRNISA